MKLTMLWECSSTRVAVALTIFGLVLGTIAGHPHMPAFTALDELFALIQ